MPALKSVQSRAMLNEENQKLFDWFTEKILGNESDCLFWSSFLQGLACRNQELTYWQLVGVAKVLSQNPQFEKIWKSSLNDCLQRTEATETVDKPTDS